TDDDYGQANVNFLKTNKIIIEQLNPLIEQGLTIVLTGFIGQSNQGKYSTFGRGGSDFTGAVVAAALSAQELQIWTDVDGICSSNPRLIKEAQVIPELSFAEASELAYFGAKVLYPKTIAPVIKENIPIRVLNTFNPPASGTLIKQVSSPGLKAITFKSEVIIMTIRSVKMLEAHGFLARIFNLFAKHKVIVDVLATSEVSLSLTVNVTPPEKLIQELSEFSEVGLIPHQAIVCLVGDQLFKTKTILNNLFTCLQDYPVKMISQGASERNITFLVNQNEVEEIVKKIYQKLFVS
ncbi:aspartate kinase, partial [Candidatus Azambacteria bacterium]|nr:aspartate kinase [Candidatus Azambacteria bacterium]